MRCLPSGQCPHEISLDVKVIAAHAVCTKPTLIRIVVWYNAPFWGEAGPRGGRWAHGKFVKARDNVVKWYGNIASQCCRRKLEEGHVVCCTTCFQ